MTSLTDLRMTCARCQAVSGAGARFCESCGAPLMAACPLCGVAVAMGARFCRGCGGSLGPASARPGELDAPAVGVGFRAC